MIEKIVTAAKTYCKPEDLMIELSPHICPQHLRNKYDIVARFLHEGSYEDNGDEYIKINLRKEIESCFEDVGIKPENIVPIYQNEYMYSCCSKHEKGAYMWSSTSREKRYDKEKRKFINTAEYNVLLCWKEDKKDA